MNSGDGPPCVFAVAKCDSKELTAPPTTKSANDPNFFAIAICKSKHKAESPPLQLRYHTL